MAGFVSTKVQAIRGKPMDFCAEKDAATRTMEFDGAGKCVTGC